MGIKCGAAGGERRCQVGPDMSGHAKHLKMLIKFFVHSETNWAQQKARAGAEYGVVCSPFSLPPLQLQLLARAIVVAAAAAVAAVVAPCGNSLAACD